MRIPPPPDKDQLEFIHRAHRHMIEARENVGSDILRAQVLASRVRSTIESMINRPLRFPADNQQISERSVVGSTSLPKVDYLPMSDVDASEVAPELGAIPFGILYFDNSEHIMKPPFESVRIEISRSPEMSPEAIGCAGSIDWPIHPIRLTYSLLRVPIPQFLIDGHIYRGGLGPRPGVAVTESGYRVFYVGL